MSRLVVVHDSACGQCSWIAGRLGGVLAVPVSVRSCRDPHLAVEFPVLRHLAHPGFAGTHLAANGQYGRSSGGIASILDAAIKAVAQSAHSGALPTLMAATADLPGSSYCGPSGIGQSRGLPEVVDSTALSHDENAQRALWELSERAVGIEYP